MHGRLPSRVSFRVPDVSGKPPLWQEEVKLTRLVLPDNTTGLPLVCIPEIGIKICRHFLTSHSLTYEMDAPSLVDHRLGELRRLGGPDRDRWIAGKSIGCGRHRSHEPGMSISLKFHQRDTI